MVITDLFAEKKTDIDTVCCIGFFDAIHEGHKELIKETIEVAHNRGLQSGLITFNKDPLEIITGNYIKQVNTLETRIKLFIELGIDHIFVIDFTQDIMNMEPDSFIEMLTESINIKTLICGFDFRFGKDARGNIDTLLKDQRFDTIVIPEKSFNGKKISTTRIKENLVLGNIGIVNKLLGRSYSLKITDNVVNDADKLILPPEGFYDVIINGDKHKIYLSNNRVLIKDNNDAVEIAGSAEVIFK